MKPSTPWLEMTVTVNPEACEAVAELLDRYGQGGAVVETLSPRPGRKSVLRVKAYLPINRNTRKRRMAIEEGLVHLRKLYHISGVMVREIAETDWTEAWKMSYKLQKIGHRLIILPTWKKYIPKKHEIVVRMDPGMAFGTGLHPTTRLCLIALERYLRVGDRFLDVGTGSGIQVIAALKLGASHATALDIEETAVNVARQNASLNDVSDRVELYTGTFKDFQSQVKPAHLIVVNILAYTIIKMLPDLKAKLLPGGYLIAGGILTELAGEFENRLVEVGLQPLERLKEEDWVTMVARSLPRP